MRKEIDKSIKKLGRLKEASHCWHMNWILITPISP